MAGSLNMAMLIGNLGRDPDVRTSQDGSKIVTLSIATSDSWKDKTTGERRERTEWHRVVIFNPHLADVAERYLRKGSKVFVEGAMQTRKWTDNAGVEKYTTEVVLGRFQGRLALLDAQRSGPPPATDPNTYGSTSTRAPAAGADTGTGWDRPADFNDDIPF